MAHPSAAILQAFGLGKLDDAQVGTVMEHLETCVGCRKVVTGQSGDDFVARLREAHGARRSPATAQSLADASRNTPLPGGNQMPSRGNVPPGLAANPQYEVVRELGRGGMGVVYLARNKLMDRPEVLKVISTAMVHKAGALDRFLREIRAAAALSHDNVVKAYSALQFGELLVFAMEYVEGDDLAKLVRTQGPLPIANACYYARQAAMGLQHAHDKKMVHRDIKPHNLILARVGKKHMVKILDFGLAKASSEKKLDRNLTGEGAMLGTPDYMAPEQSLDASTADIRADIYSLGCTLYYLLTGAPPFDATSLVGLLLAHQNTEARSLNLVRPDVPVELAAVVARMMAKDPARRYQKPVEVAQALTPFFTKPGFKGSGEQPVIAVAKGVQAPPRRPDAPFKRSETVGAARAATFLPRDQSADDPFAFVPVAVVQKPIPTIAPKRFKPLLLLGLAASVVFLALLLWGAGVLRVQTKDGTIVLENLPPGADVLVDGGIVIVKSAHGKSFEVSIAADKKHRLEVKKEGFKVFGDEVEISAGGRKSIRVRLEPIVEQGNGDRPKGPPEVIPPQPEPPVFAPDSGRGQSLPAASEDFVPLFNGIDTTGWKTHPSQPGNWRVVNFILTGSGPDVSHLFTERGDYADFHLRAVARINEGGSSAVLVRTPFDSYYPTTTRLWVPGYEAMINSTKGGTIKTGSLYSYADDVLRRAHDSTAAPGEWFTLDVIAEGNHLLIKVNGIITADYTDEHRRYGKGHIVLQQGDEQTVVEFRKIEIKELTATKPEVAKPADQSFGSLPERLITDIREMFLQKKNSGVLYPRLALLADKIEEIHSDIKKTPQQKAAEIVEAVNESLGDAPHSIISEDVKVDLRKLLQDENKGYQRTLEKIGGKRLTTLQGGANREAPAPADPKKSDGSNGNKSVEKKTGSQRDKIKKISAPSVVGTWDATFRGGATAVFIFTPDQSFAGDNRYQGRWDQAGHKVTVTVTTPSEDVPKWEGEIDASGEKMTLANGSHGVGIYVLRSKKISVHPVVGTWDGTFEKNGVMVVFDFKSDQTLTGTNGYKGHWDQTGRKVIVIGTLPPDKMDKRDIKWEGDIDQTGKTMTLTNGYGGVWQYKLR